MAIVEGRTQVKSGSVADWSTSTYVPLLGELVLVTGTTQYLRLGNGSSAVKDLPNYTSIAAGFQIGTVTKLASDAVPTVALRTVSGVTYMDFGIPQGAAGADGGGTGGTGGGVIFLSATAAIPSGTPNGTIISRDLTAN